MTADQKAVKEKAQLAQEVAAWAESVINQAKRIAERKRPPDSSAESINDAINAPLPPESSAEEVL